MPANDGMEGILQIRSGLLVLIPTSLGFPSIVFVRRSQEPTLSRR
jgi:hypothetical protein